MKRFRNLFGTCTASVLLILCAPNCSYGDEIFELTSSASIALKNQDYTKAEALALKALNLSNTEQKKAKVLYLLVKIYAARNEHEKMEPVLRSYCNCIRSLNGANSLEYAASLDFYAKLLIKLERKAEAAAFSAKAKSIRSAVSGNSTIDPSNDQPREVEGQESRNVTRSSIDIILQATPEEIARATRTYSQWDWKNGTTYSKGSLPGRLSEPAHEIARKHSIDFRTILNELEHGKIFIETFDGMLFMADESAESETSGWLKGTDIVIFTLRNRSHPVYGMATQDSDIENTDKQITVRLLHKL